MEAVQDKSSNALWRIKSWRRDVIAGKYISLHNSFSTTTIDSMNVLLR
jgi:hypothetical protein